MPMAIDFYLKIDVYGNRQTKYVYISDNLVAGYCEFLKLLGYRRVLDVKRSRSEFTKVLKGGFSVNREFIPPKLIT